MVQEALPWQACCFEEHSSTSTHETFMGGCACTQPKLQGFSSRIVFVVSTESTVCCFAIKTPSVETEWLKALVVADARNATSPNSVETSSGCMLASVKFGSCRVTIASPRKVDFRAMSMYTASPRPDPWPGPASLAGVTSLPCHEGLPTAVP